MEERTIRARFVYAIDGRRVLMPSRWRSMSVVADLIDVSGSGKVEYVNGGRTWIVFSDPLTQTMAFNAEPLNFIVLVGDVAYIGSGVMKAVDNYPTTLTILGTIPMERRARRVRSRVA